MAKNIKAIDISYCQTNVDFKALKASGVTTVVIRTGYLNKTDDMFDSHMTKAIEAGMDIGVYTYVLSDTPEKAVSEATQTVQRLVKYKGKVNLPIFCDIEDNRFLTDKFTKELRTEIVLSFCKTIRQCGYYPALYINPSWLENYVDKTKLVGKYDIWLAAWTNSATTPTKYNYGQVMWQWGVSTVAGISGQVDSDIVYIDYPAKIKKTGLNFLKTSNGLSVNIVQKSEGRAAIRSAPSKSAPLLGRCIKGNEYAMEAKISNKEGRWFKHSGFEGYSMYMDGAILFTNGTNSKFGELSANFGGNAICTVGETDEKCKIKDLAKGK